MTNILNPENATEMRKLLVPILCAVLLAACSGGQKQNNGGQAAEVGDSAKIVSDNSETVSGDQRSIAEEIFHSINVTSRYENECDGYFGGLACGERSFPDKGEGCIYGQDIYCFPKNDGGYLVVERSYYIRLECPPEYRYYTRYFKEDCNYDHANKNVPALPSPKLEMLLNPNKISGHELNIAVFKSMYDKNPSEYLFYICLPPNTLKVALYPWNCEGATCNMDQYMLSSRYGDQLLEYKWNGTQFVVNPETVPSTNLESIIGSDDNSTVAMRFWKKMLKKYDPFGRLDGDELPTEEMIADNLKLITENGSTVAVFETGGAEGFSETAACYPKKDGSWIVLLYWSSNDSPNHKLNVYNFDGSNITRLENYFPNYFLANGRYISSLDTDEFAVVRDADEEEIVDWYEWNGEEFDN